MPRKETIPEYDAVRRRLIPVLLAGDQEAKGLREWLVNEFDGADEAYDSPTMQWLLGHAIDSYEFRHMEEDHRRHGSSHPPKLPPTTPRAAALRVSPATESERR